MYILLSFLSTLAVFITVNGNECTVENNIKNDCGYEGVTQTSCEAKGCCWSQVNDNSTPWCYDATGVTSPGYELVDGKMTTTSTGYKGTLQRVTTSNKHKYYGEDIDTLTVELLLEDSDYIRMKIYATDGDNWEIPQSIVERPDQVNAIKTTLLNYDVTYTATPFTIQVTRKSDSKVIFSSSQELFYKSQYIEFTTLYDNSAKTYGLGESTRLNHALKTDNSIYTLWASDTPAAVQNVNLYSSFPIYLQMVDGSAHGGMMMNSNGMDIVLGATTLTYKMLGGIIDFYVFIGSTPIDVMAQYTSIVGRPTMQPYWAYGFHNCKYGYESISQVEDVVAGYASAGIPLDTQWLDIDYMQNYRDFTWDSKNFPISDVKSFVDTLHNNSQQFVTIVDPGIMIYDNYDAYTQGMKEDIFIKDITGEPYLGQVWPGPTYFPDFTHPKSTDYWTTQMQQFYDDVPVDGIWIDMNEVSNFCNDDGKGQTCVNSASDGCPSPGASQTDCCLVCTEVDATNTLDYPEYQINNNKGLLSVKTVSMSSTQYGNTTVYDTHNLYGLTEQIATNAALTTVRSKRPFLLTRSAFLSTGKHSAKWTGDNGKRYIVYVHELPNPIPTLH